jgi:hypothetical protein
MIADHGRAGPLDAPHRGNAAAAAGVACGVLGLLVLLVTFGVLSLPFGVAALLLGLLGRRNRQHGRTTGGRHASHLAIVLGLAVSLMSLVTWLLLALDLTSLDGLLELFDDAEVDPAR